ncbi:hypothetical protein GCM10010286_54500 [Streptomyces toxytricini]|nr:hypothetical protein GCM10010286_54500 [Streptomyces toxytricini]
MAAAEAGVANETAAERVRPIPAARVETRCTALARMVLLRLRVNRRHQMIIFWHVQANRRDPAGSGCAAGPAPQPCGGQQYVKELILSLIHEGTEGHFSQGPILNCAPP